MPDELACMKIAKALEIDGDVLAAKIQAQRARDDETRAFWERLAARLQSGAVHSALLALLVGIGFTTTTPSAHAGVTDKSAIERLYIMFTFLRRLFGQLAGARMGNVRGFDQVRNHVQSAFSIAPALAFD